MGAEMLAGHEPGRRAHGQNHEHRAERERTAERLLAVDRGAILRSRSGHRLVGAPAENKGVHPRTPLLAVWNRAVAATEPAAAAGTAQARGGQPARRRHLV